MRCVQLFDVPSAIHRGVLCYMQAKSFRVHSLQLVLNEITDSSATALQAIKLLAKYKAGKIAKVRTEHRCTNTRKEMIPRHT